MALQSRPTTSTLGFLPTTAAFLLCFEASYRSARFASTTPQNKTPATKKGEQTPTNEEICSPLYFTFINLPLTPELFNSCLCLCTDKILLYVDSIACRKFRIIILYCLVYLCLSFEILLLTIHHSFLYHEKWCVECIIFR